MNDDWLDDLSEAGDDDAEGFVQFGFGGDPIETPWLTPPQAADYLKVSLRKLETLREDTPDNVPTPWRKLGRTIRWNRDEMDRWIDGIGRVQARRRRRC